MNTKKIVYILTGTFLVLLVIALFLTFSSSPQSTAPTPLPTITKILQPNTGEFTLTSLDPQNTSTDIPIMVKPSFTFSSVIEEVIPEIVISPNTPFTYAITGNVLTITPTNTLTPSTRYDISVEIKDQNFFTSFTTTGPTPTPLPDTKDAELLEQQEEDLKAQRPDIYLSNHTPYNGENISVTSTFVTTPSGHFRFTVTSKNTTNVQSDFNVWAQENGLTDAQTSSLDVIYN